MTFNADSGQGGQPPQQSGAQPFQTNEPQGTQPQGAGAPGPAHTSKFSVGAIVLVVAGILALVSYPLKWYVATEGFQGSITGLGATTDGATFESSRMHWIPLGIGVVAIITGIARLIGKYDHEKWRSPVTVFTVLAVVGLGATIFLNPEGGTLAIGAYLAIVAMVIAAVGFITVEYLKK